MAVDGLTTLLQRLRSLGTFESFKVPAYRFFFLGMIGQWASFSMEAVARTYLMYDITNSKAMLGYVALAGGIPVILLSLFGGALADRLPKKHLIQMSQVVMTVVTLGHAVAISLGYLTPAHPESWWVLMVGAVFMGVIMAISMPSRQAIIPELVSREQIMNAISLNTLGMSVFQVAGPVIAGYTIDWFGYAVTYYVMAAIQGAAIVFTSFLPRVRPAAVTLRKTVLADVRAGFRYILVHRTILVILVFFVLSILLAMPHQMMMPVFARDILKVGAAGQGTLMTFSGLGALVSSLTLASLPSRRRGPILLGANVLMGASLFVFAFSVSWPLSLGMMVLVGIGRTATMTSGAALLQTHVEPAYLGRVMSIMMMNMGLSSIGTFFAGVLAESVSAQWAIGGMAIVLGVVSLAGFVPRTVRKLE